MITTETILETSFSHIVGQDIAKERLSNAVASAANGGEKESPLVLAEAGCGKSHICRAYGKALADHTGADFLFFNSPAEFRSKGEAFSSLLTILHDSPNYVIVMDEAHLFRDRPTVQTEKILAFCMKALDKQNQGGHIRLDDEITVEFNRRKGAIVLATNFPHKLSKDGALQSRCNVLQLDAYTPKELQKILSLMLKERGLTCLAKDAAIVAKCGRGTARPMEKIVDELSIMHSASGSNEKNVTKEQIIRALQLTKQYPAGLNVDEIGILARCDGQAVTRVRLSMMLPHLETKVLNNSCGYLQNIPVTKDDGEIDFRPFLAAVTGGLQTTEIAKRYLRDIAKAGFNVPAKYSITKEEAKG